VESEKRSLARPSSGRSASVRGWRASVAALSRRFVVPVALVWPDRAEQTRTSLWPESSSFLVMSPHYWTMGKRGAHGTMTSAMFSRNLPRLVPPNLATWYTPDSGWPLIHSYTWSLPKTLLCG
jgi:hypothetical protein